MTRAKASNPDFLNGVPELLILQLLARQPMYGYELVQTIGRTTGRRLEFGEGCVYPILHRLERNGILCGRHEQVGGRARIVYRLTPKGHKQLERSASLWQEVVSAVNLVLRGGSDARASLA
jgi:PadR family transcriptional regulator PadR